MQPRQPQAPRRQLNPQFRQAARDAMSRAYKSHVMASLGGFPHSTSFSNALHADKIAATPLAIGRLQRVADAIRFTGDVVLPETSEVVV
jgi:hypothetical protein